MDERIEEDLDHLVTKSVSLEEVERAYCLPKLTKAKKTKICRFCGELDTVDRRKQKYHCHREEQKDFFQWIGYDAKAYDGDLLYYCLGQYIYGEIFASKNQSQHTAEQELGYYVRIFNLDRIKLELNFLKNKTAHLDARFDRLENNINEMQKDRNES